MKDRKQLVVVLGMHRSGTSLITRGLKALGVDLGDNFLPPMQGVNETGFWEDLDINTLNIELLNYFGQSWDTIKPIDDLNFKDERIQHFTLRAIELLNSKIHNVDSFGIKDPRIAKLLPFWKMVFDHLPVDVVYVICVRNPLSIIKSLEKRDNFSFEKSGYLWLTHIVSSVFYTEGEARIFVDYDLLMNNPEKELSRIAHVLGRFFNKESLKSREYINDFISEKLQHTKYAVQDLVLISGIPPESVEVFTMLTNLSRDTLVPESEIVIEYFKKLNKSILALYPILNLVSKNENRIMSLKQQNKELVASEAILKEDHPQKKDLEISEAQNNELVEYDSVPRKVGVKVSIIIPVYKDWQSLYDCLVSCDEYIDDNHEILVINDASPEEGIEKNIKEFINEKPKFKYYKNEENLGFVKTCNLGVGVASQGNDILLLNSDTIVTKGFLEEMVDCLYASDRHGVCCPRSNNATILSVPFYYNESRYDEDYLQISVSVWRYIKNILPRYHVIPTGVGFCMLIKRQLITNFGLFDELYLAGYNEENDFCCRINRFGYSAIAANHAFVFHLETKSFPKRQKILLEKRNRAILDGRYPEYSNAVSHYINWDLPVTERFADLLGGCYTKKKVLFDITRILSLKNGTTEHAMSLLEALYPQASVEYDFYIAVNSSADKFFNISELFQNVIVTDSGELPFCFDCIYIPQQVFEYRNLFMINRFGLKYIVGMLDIISVRSNYLRTKDLKSIFRTTITTADGILVNTESVWKDIQDFFFISKSKNQLIQSMHISKSIYQGYDGDRSASEEKIINTLPLKYVLIVGNKYHHKALKITLQNISAGCPVVVFGGWQGMADDFKNLENATFLESGGLSDGLVHYLYEHCESIIYPSQYEGFGLPVLSAINYNKPIILFNSSTNREVTERYKNKAQFFFFDYFYELNTLILQASNYVEENNKTVQLERGWDIVAAETLAFIGKVVNSPVDIDALKKRNDFISQLELVYKHTVVTAAPRVTVRKTRLAQFVHDIPRAFYFIKKAGFVQGGKRLFWYIQGVRMIPKK